MTNYHTEFLTGTIFGWNHLLKDDSHKDIIVDSLQWLATKQKCIVNAFVIMPNHFHLIWKISDGFEREKVQGAFFSFAAHKFKEKLNRNNSTLLESYLVNKVDR